MQVKVPDLTAAEPARACRLLRGGPVVSWLEERHLMQVNPRRPVLAGVLRDGQRGTERGQVPISSVLSLTAAAYGSSPMCVDPPGRPHAPSGRRCSRYRHFPSAGWRARIIRNAARDWSSSAPLAFPKSASGGSTFTPAGAGTQRTGMDQAQDAARGEGRIEGDVPVLGRVLADVAGARRQPAGACG